MHRGFYIEWEKMNTNLCKQVIVFAISIVCRVLYLLGQDKNPFRIDCETSYVWFSFSFYFFASCNWLSWVQIHLFYEMHWRHLCLMFWSLVIYEQEKTTYLENVSPFEMLKKKNWIPTERVTYREINKEKLHGFYSVYTIHLLNKRNLFSVIKSPRHKWL